MKNQNIATHFAASHQRNAAITLIVVNVLSVVVMAHHPTASTHSALGFIQSLVAMRSLNQWVHGVLIATTLITGLCLLEFSVHNLKQIHVRNGMVLYALGALAMAVAALTNGFVITRMADGLLQSPAALQAASPLAFQLTWAVNQTLAEFAVIAMCAGIACWSMQLLIGAGLSKYARTLGGIGLLLTTMQMLMQWLQHGNYGVPQMLVFVLWHGLWCIGIAFLMLARAKQTAPVMA
jgi:hypothetical protein